MTHYDDFPYPSPDDWTPDEAKALLCDWAPRHDNWDDFWPGETPAPKTALSVGCGVFEAVMLAAQEPLLSVTGIDASAKAIEHARLKAEGLSNVRFIHADFLTGWLPNPYDYVLCGGVLHHIRRADLFLERLARCVKPETGRLVVMVYGDYERKYIPDFAEIFDLIGVARDARGVAFVRSMLGQLAFKHPMATFYRRVRDSDSQIVDMLLHPYFKQYRADELVGLLAKHGLMLMGWMNDACDYGHLRFDDPVYAARWDELSEGARCRVGQIMNHRDAKLAAMFKLADRS